MSGNHLNIHLLRVDVQLNLYCECILLCTMQKECHKIEVYLFSVVKIEKCLSYKKQII